MAVLILSNRNDEHVQLVLPGLHRRNITSKVVFSDEYLSSFSLESKVNNTYQSHCMDAQDMAQVKSVWYRRPLLAERADQNPLYQAYINDEIEGYTSFFFNSLEHANWISKPSNIELARNKILQLTYAKDAQLGIPDTLITTKIDSFQEFFEKYDQKVIIKSIKGHWYDNLNGENYLFFTSLLEKDKLPTAESLQQAPCLFQQYIEKELELRATVVGERVFTAALYSQEKEVAKVDWRLGTGSIRHEIYRLPVEIEKKLIHITHRFGLKFGAYDLILTPVGEYIFLELNPNGQWGWVEQRTGLKISEAIADLLTYEH